MANLNLKNIPDDLYDRLKESANANHRSINSELIVCLEKRFSPQRLSVEENLSKIRALRKRVNAKKVSAKEISSAKHLGRP